MKKIVITLVFTLLVSIVFAQQNTRIVGSKNFVSLSLSTADKKDIIYVLWPNSRRGLYISETCPTANVRPSGDEGYVAGDVDLCFRPAIVSGSSPSIAIWMKPLVYDPVNDSYAIVPSDSTFLVAGTPNVYWSESVSYLTFNDGELYHIALSGLVWSVEGAVFIVRLHNDFTGSITMPCWLKISQ